MSEQFRRKATVVFRLTVVGLALLAAGIAAFGWWIGRWWGLGIGAALGSLIFVGGMVGAGLIYAMSQDGG